MSRIATDDVLNAMTRFYLSSRDFNGIPAAALAAELNAEWPALHSVLPELIEEEKIGLLYGEVHGNSHIIRTGFESKENQLTRLDTKNLHQTCVYPCPKHHKIGGGTLSIRSRTLCATPGFRNASTYLLLV